MVSVGTSHSCAIVKDSFSAVNTKVKCWGNNGYGQLGNGTTTNSSVPTEVIGLIHATYVSVGNDHTCANNLGVVYCWGFNNFGQLGDGTTSSSSIPIEVQNMSTFGNSGIVSAGNGYTCATSNIGGKVRCWGFNGSGQLGNGTNTNSLVPVDVVGINATKISANLDHTCALSQGSDTHVRCWGNNYFGQLGDGTTSDSYVPVDTGFDAFDLSVGISHTCAYNGFGVKCWGDNSLGQLGDGTTTNSSIPTSTTINGTIRGISVGVDHTCTILGPIATQHQVKCWGNNNVGQLGDGTTTNSSIPINVNSLTAEFVSVSSGVYHTCVVDSNGAVKCWGRNNYGQLGNGTTINSLSTPVSVSF
jgi:alpha-tubulin suppressor-like RCC1 family protein